MTSEAWHMEASGGGGSPRLTDLSTADLKRVFDEFHAEQARLSASIREGIRELDAMATRRRFALSRSHRAVKRAFDLLVGSILALLLLPLFVLIAITVKTGCRGPLFFSVARIGKDGRRFRSWYFRTVTRRALDEYVTVGPDGVPLERSWDRELFTNIGWQLRKRGLDALPLLWNVLRGDMSLVGPRPLWESEFERLDSSVRDCYVFPPGVTGRWRVEAGDPRAENRPLDAIVEDDCRYAAAWSFGTDMAILARSVPRALSRLVGRDDDEQPAER